MSGSTWKAASIFVGIALIAGASAAEPGTAATTTTVVSVTVPTVTSVDATGCSTASTATNFGTVLPESTAVTTACTVLFGSSNSTPSLRLYQADGVGDAMWRTTLGQLDTTFDGNTGSGNGVVATAGTVVAGSSRGPRIGVDPRDGAIVTAQEVAGDVRVTRMSSTGVLDTLFDGPTGTGDGVVSIDTNTPPRGLAVQDDGKIVITYAASVGAAQRFGLIRLLPDGTLDPALDSSADDGTATPNGIIERTFLSDAGGSYGVGSVVVQPDGKLVIGLRPNTSLSNPYAILVRILSTGQFDPTFGTGGVGFLATASGPVAAHLALQPDGAILFAGDNFGTLTTSLGRFLANGTPDASFDGPSGTGNGFFRLNPFPEDFVMDIDYEPKTGTVVIVSNVDSSTTPIRVRRFLTASGALDTSFDGASGTGNGTVALDPTSGDDFVAEEGMLLSGDGSITLAGRTTSGTGDATLVRLNSQGLLDTSLDGDSGNGNGVVTTPLDPAADEFTGIAQATEGDIVALGSGGAPASQRLARYDTVTLADYAGAPNNWAGPTTASFFGVCLQSLTGTSPTVTWTAHASCATSDGAWWRSVPDGAAAPGILVGSIGSTATDGVAVFRFGMRAAATQPPGSYLAPVVFSVVAP